jgi:3-(3-hydroxy-phenyl)propionate hydroxylase
MVMAESASPDLLDAYELERRPHAEAAVRLSVRAGRFIGAAGPAAWARDLVLATARRVPNLARRLDDVRAGAPNLRSFVAGRLGQPLRAVPQPWVTTASGARCRLDDLLGCGWAVVGIGLDPQAWAGDDHLWAAIDCRLIRIKGTGEVHPPETSVLHDTDQVLARWAGGTDPGPVALVVRPDRHLFGIYGENDGARASTELRLALGLR